MTGRAALATALGLGGLGLAIALVALDVGPLARPGARVMLADATPATLDTVTVRGRRVEASLDGIVVQIGPGDDVWLASGTDAVALRFPSDPALEIEDRVLAVGRVRARGGARWIDVASWSRVAADVRPPSGATP